MTGAAAIAARQKHAKLLNDLAKNGVEPQDPEVRRKYDEFKIDVTKQALKILKERIPAKILYFNEQVNVNSAPGEFLHLRDLELSLPVVPAECLNGTSNAPTASAPETAIASGNAAKRQRKEDIVGFPSTAPSGVQPPASESSGAVKTPVVYPQAVPVHRQIVEMEERVGKDALELIEMVGTVKLWIQLNIPRIEDGNNFGVAIQEEAIQELGRVEDAAFSLCDGIKYHTARAKLVSKVIKYPNVADYTQSILEIDRKEWLHLKVSLVDMRNSYSMLYDLLHKNWEKVVKPRAAENNLMVM